MIRTPSCSDSERLVLFVQGLLPEAETAEIAEHTDQCPLCQASLSQMDLQQRGLLQQLRKGFARETDLRKAAPLTLDDARATNEGLTTSPSWPPGGSNGDRGDLLRLLKRLEDLVQQPVASRQSLDWLVWAGETFGRADDGQPMLSEFRLQRVLGAGGMGIVFEARDASLERLVAIKVLRPELAVDERNRERFLTEAQAMAALSHPHLVRVFRTGIFCQLPFLAMELLTGETLAQRLSCGPALTLLQILEIGRDVARGMAAIHHHGLVHRDVKPENIILEWSSDRCFAKLLDFGLARDVSKSDLDEDRGWVLGTPAFMSPEQAQGESVTARSDLFSLGCVLYRVLSGRLPFVGETPQAMLRARSTQSPVSLRILVPTLAPEITDLVDRLLAGDPQRRPACAADVAHELERMARRLRPRFTRRQAAMAAGLVTLIAVVLLISNHLKTTEPAPTNVRSPPASPNQTATDSMITENDAAESASKPVVRPSTPPLAPEWFERVSKLAPEPQVAEVVAEIKRRNPDWEGTHEFGQRAGTVTRFRFSPHHVSDLSPVRALVELEFLQFPGRETAGDVFDLTPLTDLPLRILDCGHNPITDFSPLTGMPLNILRAKSTEVSDLRPLSDLPLTTLQLAETRVTDLSPIKNCPLRLLSFWNTRVSDLSPLEGMRTLNRLECERTGVSDLSPLKGLKLTYLACEGSPIRDYSLLREFPLEELHISYDPAAHRELLLSIPTLNRINYRPAGDILK